MRNAASALFKSYMQEMAILLHAREVFVCTDSNEGYSQRGLDVYRSLHLQLQLFQILIHPLLVTFLYTFFSFHCNLKLKYTF
jgi:hypothetical protein